MAAENLPNKILVVDDDPSVGVSIEQGLQKHGIAVVKCVDLDSALYQFNQGRFEVVLVELDFGPLPGLALIQKWRNHEMIEKRNAGFILLGSGGQRSAGNEGLMKELSDIELLMKPVSPIQLLPVIARAYSNKNKAAAFVEVKTRLIDPLVKQGNYSKALEIAQGMIPELGDKAKLLVVDLLEKAGNFKECLDMSVSLLKGDGNNIGLINTAGRMCMKLGKLADAKSFLEKADSLAPMNLDRMNSMAQLYLQAKFPEKAVGVFKQLVKLNPEHPEYKFDVFKKLYDAGYDEHAVSFGKDVAQPMEIVRHYNNKGVLLAKDGRQPEAIKEYERAVKFFPKFKENNRIYYNMALALIASKNKEDYKKAVDLLKMAIALDPTFEKAKTTLATLEKNIAAA
ncbi:MAG: tetratricopeptide repeat protein [Proteobacteria bacterium]|nr:tetratricopeptide repeat protein [Pseudomonadota bacterium]